MTCIVGIADGKSVWMGSDSSAVGINYVAIVADPKVFVVRDIAIGYEDSFRMGQLLQDKLKIVPRRKNQAASNYIRRTFTDAVRRTFKIHGFSEIRNHVEIGGVFLVGYEGHLYEMQSDFSILQFSEYESAIGAGQEYALGSLHTTKTLPLDPEKRIALALAAAAKYSPNVKPPFNIIKIGDAKARKNGSTSDGSGRGKPRKRKPKAPSS